MHECIDDSANEADMSMDKTTAITTVSASIDAATSHHAPNTPFEGEQSGQEFTGEVGARTEVGEGKDNSKKHPPDKSSKPMKPTSPPDEAGATQDQGLQPATSMSTQRVPFDHPDKDAGMRNPPQPSEDPGDAMGDNEHHSDAPIELSNKPEGRRGQRGKTRVFKVSRECTGSMDDNNIETH